jgi:serine/threonine protein kinase
MLEASGHLKIIDLSFALPIMGPLEQAMTPTGSLSYMPPELIGNDSDGNGGHKKGGRHMDWWAMGVFAYELMAGRTPWSSLSNKNILRKENLTRKVPAPPNVSSQAKMLVTSLLEPDYIKRLGTNFDTEVTWASFFEGVDWEAMERGETEPAFVPRVNGPSVLDKGESSQALASYYQDTQKPTQGQFFWETGKFGVKSPWFLTKSVGALYAGLLVLFQGRGVRGGRPLVPFASG